MSELENWAWSLFIPVPSLIAALLIHLWYSPTRHSAQRIPVSKTSHEPGDNSEKYKKAKIWHEATGTVFGAVFIALGQAYGGTTTLAGYLATLFGVVCLLVIANHILWIFVFRRPLFRVASVISSLLLLLPIDRPTLAPGSGRIGFFIASSKSAANAVLLTNNFLVARFMEPHIPLGYVAFQVPSGSSNLSVWLLATNSSRHTQENLQVAFGFSDKLKYEASGWIEADGDSTVAINRISGKLDTNTLRILVCRPPAPVHIGDSLWLPPITFPGISLRENLGTALITTKYKDSGAAGLAFNFVAIATPFSSTKPIVKVGATNSSGAVTATFSKDDFME